MNKLNLIQVIHRIYNYTVIYFLIFSNKESPIPDTFLISSIELKLPFSSLYFTILLAFDSPIPVMDESSFVAAVLIFTKLLFFVFWVIVLLLTFVFSEFDLFT